MTRKQYTRRVQALALAIYHHPESIYPKNYRIGDALRHIRDVSKNVPKMFGSYAAAWNCDAVKWAREFYGVK